MSSRPHWTDLPGPISEANPLGRRRLQQRASPSLAPPNWVARRSLIESGAMITCSLSLRPKGRGAHSACPSAVGLLLLASAAMLVSSPIQAQVAAAGAKSAVNSAAAADPTDPSAVVPAAKPPQALQRYKAAKLDPVIADWPQANRTVKEAGGWRAYAKEASSASSSAPASPAASAAPASRHDHGAHGGKK